MELRKLIEKYKGKTKNVSLLETANDFLIYEDLTPFRTWITNKIAANIPKNNTTSQQLRKHGNKVYLKKNFVASIKLYTAALKFAEFASDEYGSALACRSAAAFGLKEYLNCLEDIRHCLNSSYEASKRFKIHLRRAKCYINLQRDNDVEDQILKLSSVMDKEEMDLFKKELEKYKKDVVLKEFNKIKVVLPTVDNENFLFAASNVELKYSNEKGRYVAAKRDISSGEVLFVEKPFSHTLIFTVESKLVKRCYNCLTNTKYLIPCERCTVSMYCSTKCKEISWAEGHCFECIGMPLWYDLGILLPALRCLFKGLRTDFKGQTCGTDNVDKFGNSDDNYEYFDALLTNFNSMDDSYIGFVVMIVIAVLYLKEHTNFFVICKKMKHQIAEKLSRHIAQLICNSSVIQHWPQHHYLNPNLLLPKNSVKSSREFLNLKVSKLDVACGIYPSVSMMNHSCKPNITMYYIDDVVVVKALDKIKEGDEIFNCYGIDYKDTSLLFRQTYLQQHYNFTCKCDVCESPNKNYDIVADYVFCPKCKTKVKQSKPICVCPKCKTDLQNIVSDLFDKIMYMDKLEIEDAIEDVSTKISENHENMIVLYKKLSQLYAKQENKEKEEYYLKKCLEICKNRNQINSLSLVHELEDHFKPNNHNNYKEMPALIQQEIHKVACLHAPLNEITIV